ncbi:F0F1-type ATP synthase subunit c/Archaeal/vacuolar-type H+-ATPase subunit K [Candidatus Scalindua japonica]|uniref:ATP synthase subunit c n=1 Tax=Candidatus Scalindua japonica TaxID=1284222 RepID=A0A286U1F0_9BACT|nr:ATP synthase F0 subunit C [Candidatus Scalindua japonica]GAX61964.1 F0F1-type ATP synthase subunit c/Archaeal/vacuolar-type H+-ATPase subunit K [Candidatus Scalindua japonica]
MIYFACVAIAIGMLAFASFGCGIGQGIAVHGASTSVARQPELFGKIQMLMFIGLGFIEALAIYSLVLSFILLGKLPDAASVLKVLSH